MDLFHRFWRSKNKTSQGDLLFGRNFRQITTYIDEALADCVDLVKRPFRFCSGEQGVIYSIDGLIDQDLFQRDLLPWLLTTPGSRIKDFYSTIPVVSIKQETSVNKAVNSLFTGFVLLVVDGWGFGLLFQLSGWKERPVEDSPIERTIRGPHEGFTENLRTNTALLRRRLSLPQLKFKEYILGKRSQTRIAVGYLEGIANPEILSELEAKIQKIDYDAILGAGYIEQLLIESPYSPFPQYQSTERPDKAAASLLEGKLIIIVDRTPVVLIAPVNFFAFFQAPDDYYASWISGSIIRFLRQTAFFLGVSLPSLYIAVLSFHYEAIPWPILTPLIESRARVPFPPIVEAFFIESIFELLREAAIRLPSYIGQAIGIIGGLIIGQAIVATGAVSTIMIIVVGITAVSNFVIPAYDMGLAVRVIRFPLMILASLFGIVGSIIGGAILFTHLLSLESLGQPYFMPLAPLSIKNLNDSLIRAPLFLINKRPRIARPLDKTRGKGYADE
ncbi:MAG: spore germination protein [Bacillota bacterium]